MIRVREIPAAESGLQASVPGTGGTSRQTGFARREGGFTLMEMMIVLTIIAILASIAVPMYQTVILRSKEAVLKENLHAMRTVIDQYTADRRSAPQVLDDLIAAGYLRQIPDDPITESNATWQVETGNTALVADQQDTGIVNVFSGAASVSSEGTPYSEW
jgi:general secretion pathway protein G